MPIDPILVCAITTATETDEPYCLNHQRYNCPIAVMRAENEKLKGGLHEINEAAWYCDDWKPGLVTVRKALRKIGYNGPQAQAAGRL